MAQTVKNTLARRLGAQNVIYNANGQEVKLSTDIVRRYLVSGNASVVTDEELVMFINLCKYNGLNPWMREAYLIKFSDRNPATLVTGKEAFMKRAEAHPQYDGMDAGVIVWNGEDVTYRDGTLVLDGETIVGGWAEVWRKDRSHSTRAEVSFNEYAGRKADGSLNSQWAGRPATMIRKVALVQALREAFPATYGGMFTAEEQNVEGIAETPIPVPEEAKQEYTGGAEQVVEIQATEPSDDSLI